MSHNFPCSPQEGKLSQLNPHLLYRQNYTSWDICINSYITVTYPIKQGELRSCIPMWERYISKITEGTHITRVGGPNLWGGISHGHL